MLETVQECIYEGLSLEELVPFGVIEVGCDDRRLPAVAFSHQFEERIDLFGFEGEVPQLIDEEQIITAEVVDELWGGAVCKGCVQIIDEILGMIEPSPVSGEEGLTQEAAGKA